MKHHFVKTNLKHPVKMCSNCGCVIVPINSEVGRKALEERRAGLLEYPKKNRAEYLKRWSKPKGGDDLKNVS